MPTWKAKPTQLTASERTQVAPKGAAHASTSDTVRSRQAAKDESLRITRQQALTAKGYHKGGSVPGKGNKDSVLAKLTPGEVVVRKGPAKAHGPMLRRLNQGGSTRYRSG